MGNRRIQFGVLALTLVVALSVVTPAVAAPAPAALRTDYPSWADVQAAKGNAAATSAQVARIEQQLTGLQSDAARLGDVAVARSADADRTTAELATATATATALSHQAAGASATAERSKAQAGAIIAALYRSGGASMTASLLMGSGASNNLLYGLGALSKLGAQVQLAMTKAATDKNLATALSQQADAAQTQREVRASAARSALANAAAAAASADAAVVSQQSGLDLLYAQLAALRNTSVQLEQQYRVGQQAAAAAAAAAAATAAASLAASTTQGSGSLQAPSGGVNDPGGAQAFAWSVLAGYGFGADQNSCLLWLWDRESGWRTNAYNSGSGAYGIPQALPGSKMAVVGADWRTNYRTQVVWGILYINGRYGSPCAAWAHSESSGWY